MMKSRFNVRNRNLRLWAPRLGLFGRLVKIGHMVSTLERKEYGEISGGENAAQHLDRNWRKYGGDRSDP